MVKKEKRPNGRPTKYHTGVATKAYKLSLLGLTDTQLAQALEISEKTLNTWKQAYPKLLQSLKAGKEIADAEVAGSLYQRACGYEHAEDKIFCTNDKEGKPQVTRVKTVKRYPPDTAAAIIWLKNRQRANWRERQDVEHSLSGRTIQTIADVFALISAKRSRLIDSEVIDGNDSSRAAEALQGETG